MAHWFGLSLSRPELLIPSNWWPRSSERYPPGPNALLSVITLFFSPLPLATRACLSQLERQAPSVSGHLSNSKSMATSLATPLSSAAACPASRWPPARTSPYSAPCATPQRGPGLPGRHFLRGSAHRVFVLLPGKEHHGTQHRPLGGSGHF